MNTRPDPRWYPPLFVGLIILLLLANLVAPPSLRLPAAAARVEPAPLRTIPDTDLNPYGANFFLQYEAEPW